MKIIYALRGLINFPLNISYFFLIDVHSHDSFKTLVGEKSGVKRQLSEKIELPSVQFNQI